MNQKLIFLDIDGTILKDGQWVSDKDFQAVHDAQLKGHKVFICTGRSKNDVPTIVKAMNCDGIVCSAGSMILIDGKETFKSTFDQETLDRILDLLIDREQFFRVEAESRTYVNKPYVVDLGEDRKDYSSELLRTFLDESLFPKYDLNSTEPVYKILVVSRKKEDLFDIKEAIKDYAGMTIFNNTLEGMDWHAGEIFQKENNKGTGIKKVASLYGVPIEDTIAIGDSMNDLDMIETAGLGVCMENGDDAVKEIADRVCPSIDKSGVSVILNELTEVGAEEV